MRELNGNSQMRGRNGWFIPKQITTQALPLPADQTISQVEVCIYSKQTGNYPPVWMWLSVEDAQRIVEEMQTAITDAILRDKVPA